MRTLMFSVKLFIILFIVMTYQPEVFAEEQIFFNYTFEGSDSTIWTDVSPGAVKWIVEVSGNPSVINPKPPPPSSGNKYLRLSPSSSDTSFAPAIFNSSYYETNGLQLERLSVGFNYWLISEFPEHNNIEVYLYQGNNYGKLPGTKFYLNSTRDSIWRPFEGEFDLSSFDTSKKFAVLIMGFCGLSSVDGIALDDIVVFGSSVSQSTSTENPASTTTTPTTTSSSSSVATTSSTSATNNSTTEYATSTTTAVTTSTTATSSTAPSEGETDTTSTTESIDYDYRTDTNPSVTTTSSITGTEMTSVSTNEESSEQDETSEPTVNTRTTEAETMTTAPSTAISTSSSYLPATDTTTTYIITGNSGTTLFPSSSKSLIAECFEAILDCKEGDYGNYPIKGDPCTSEYCVCDANSGIHKAYCSPEGHYFDSESKTCKGCGQVEACKGSKECGNSHSVHL